MFLNFCFFLLLAVISSDFSRDGEDWLTFEDGNEIPLRHDYAKGIVGVQSVPDLTSTTPSNGAYFSAPGKHLPIVETYAKKSELAHNYTFIENFTDVG